MRILDISNPLSYTGILPELSLFAGIILCGLVLYFMPRLASGLSVWIVLATLITAFFLSEKTSESNESGILLNREWTWLLRRYFCASSAAFLFVWLEWKQEKKEKIPTLFFPLILMCCLSLMILSEASGFWLMLISAECFSFCAYALVLNPEKTESSGESILRYFGSGALATAISIFGLSWIAGFGALHQDYLPIPEQVVDFFPLAGAVLFLSFLFFKTGSFPFQLWVPSVFTSSPSPVAGYLASAPKVAAAFACLNLVGRMDVNLSYPIALIALISGIWGNLAAFQSKKITTMLAWSAIGQAAFLLIPAIFFRQINGAAEHLLYFSIVYGCAVQASFSACQYFEIQQHSELRIADFAGKFKWNSYASSLLILLLLSIIGLPPTAGFTAKLFILSGLTAGTNLMGNALPVLVFSSAILITVMAAGYFFQIPYQMVFKSSGTDEAPRRNAPVSVMLMTLAAGMLILFFFKPDLIQP